MVAGRGKPRIQCADDAHYFGGINAHSPRITTLKHGRERNSRETIEQYTGLQKTHGEEVTISRMALQLVADCPSFAALQTILHLVDGRGN